MAEIYIILAAESHYRVSLYYPEYDKSADPN